MTREERASLLHLLRDLEADLGYQIEEGIELNAPHYLGEVSKAVRGLEGGLAEEGFCRVCGGLGTIPGTGAPCESHPYWHVARVEGEELAG